MLIYYLSARQSGNKYQIELKKKLKVKQKTEFENKFRKIKKFLTRNNKYAIII